MEISVDIVDGKLVKDEMTKNARGGTEMLADRLLSVVDPSLLQNVQIIFSRPGKLLDGYRKVLYLHDLPEDPAIAQFAEAEFRNQFDFIVFVSHYQRDRFIRHFGIEATDNMVVIKNAIYPIEEHVKPSDKLRLIYHTTPHRGLYILAAVFKHLAIEFPGLLELKVFSSFDIYGWGERDQQYEGLFKMLQDHKDVVYSKSVPNEQIRQELRQAHIFAFPSVWEETSCMALMEAMSANLDCIHPSYGALPETSFGFNEMYPYVTDYDAHANILYSITRNHIRGFLDTPGYNLHRLDSKAVIDRFHDLDTFKFVWETHLRA